MKQFLVSMLAILLVLSATAQKDIINDPNAAVRELSGSFTSIKVTGGIDVFLSEGGEEAIAVSAAETKYRDAIKTEINNGQLRIYFEGEKAWNNWKNKNLRVYVSFKKLEKLEATGACDVQVSGVITQPSLQLNFSGASDFKGAVAVTDLKIELSGASDVTIKVPP